MTIDKTKLVNAPIIRTQKQLSKCIASLSFSGHLYTQMNILQLVNVSDVLIPFQLSKLDEIECFKDDTVIRKELLEKHSKIACTSTGNAEDDVCECADCLLVPDSHSLSIMQKTFVTSVAKSAGCDCIYRIDFLHTDRHYIMTSIYLKKLSPALENAIKDKVLLNVGVYSFSILPDRNFMSLGGETLVALAHLDILTPKAGGGYFEKDTNRKISYLYNTHIVKSALDKD